MFHRARNVTIYGGKFTNIQGRSDTIHRMKRMLEDDERNKILCWACPVDASAKHYDISSIHHPGTGEWLLESDEFRAWIGGAGQVLWCRGNPGAGKTILASLIINYLCALRSSKPIGSIGVAWVYFNYQEESTQTPDALRLSLLQQLAVFSKTLFAYLKSAYSESKGSRPPPGQLIPDIGALARAYSTVFIVVDGLDECATDYRDDVLGILSDLQNAGVNILITSRHGVEENIARSRLVNAQRITIRGSTDDIIKYVDACMNKQKRLPRNIQRAPSLRDEIIQVILNLCEGIFLIAAFHINLLGDRINPGEVREALKLLPSKLPDIYAKTLIRIERDKVNAGVALRVLSYLIHTRRPLTVLELQHFLAVMPGHTDLLDEYITDMNILLSLCAGLVAVDDQTSTVRLVNSTTQEYLKNQHSKFSGGDRDMGHTCLVYLSFEPFKNISDLSHSLHRYVLLEYVVHYWSIHVSDHQQALKAPLYAFFKDDALLRAYAHFMYSYRQDYFEHDQNTTGMRHDYAHIGLHAAAAVGLVLVAEWLIADDADVDAQDATGGTAMMYASRGGHVKVANLLIANHADVNMECGRYRRALYVAAYHGHGEIVTLLLEHCVETDVRRRQALTALQVAAGGSHAEVVELLRKHCGDVGT